MSKKKSESPEPEVKNETIRDILEEQHESETLESDVKPETQEKETPPEESKEEPKAEQPPLDREKIKEELKAEVSQEVSDSIVKSLKGEREEKDVPQTPWEKENRTPTWKEALEYAGEQAEKRLEEKQTAKQQAEEAQRTQALTAAEDNKQKWNSYWDMQIDELTASGKLPKVEKKDASDTGMKARQELFAQMVKVNTERVAEGKPQITSLKEIYYEHYTPVTQQPAGANAPVAGKVRSGSGSQTSDRYTSADRKKSFTQLLKEATGLA